MKGLICAVAVIASSAGGVTWIVSTANPERTLSTFSTTFEGRLSDQRHNACLAAAKLDGTVVQPGAVLSFNQIVGTWSRDQGYRKAPVSFSGTLINSWGGGVCQTSTTLYNAGLLAGLELLERHSHQFAANYVPPGRDAAVAYSNIDLKFKNNFDFPIKLKVETSEDALTVRIVGRGTARPVAIRQRVLSAKVPGIRRFGTGGSLRVRNPGKAGYEVETYRTIGETTELLSQDSYPAMDRVVQRTESPNP